MMTDSDDTPIDPPARLAELRLMLATLQRYGERLRSVDFLPLMGWRPMLDGPIGDVCWLMAGVIEEIEGQEKSTVEVVIPGAMVTQKAA